MIRMISRLNPSPTICESTAPSKPVRASVKCYGYAARVLVRVGVRDRVRIRDEVKVSVRCKVFGARC